MLSCGVKRERYQRRLCERIFIALIVFFFLVPPTDVILSTSTLRRPHRIIMCELCDRNGDGISNRAEEHSKRNLIILIFAVFLAREKIERAALYERVNGDR